MRKRSSGNYKRLVDARVDQSRVMYFPDGWRSAYDAYVSLYHRHVTESKPPGIKYVLRQVMLLAAWFAVLTAFFVVQRQMLAHQTPGLQHISALKLNRNL